MNPPDFVIEYLNNPSSLSNVKKKMAEEWINKNKDSVNKYLVKRGVIIEGKRELPQFQDYLAYKRDGDKFNNSPYYLEENKLKKDIAKSEGIEITDSPIDYALGFAKKPLDLMKIPKAITQAKAVKQVGEKVVKPIADNISVTIKGFVDKTKEAIRATTDELINSILKKNPKIKTLELEDYINKSLREKGYPVDVKVSKLKDYEGNGYAIKIDKFNEGTYKGRIELTPNYYKKTGIKPIDNKISEIKTSTYNPDYMGYEGLRKTLDYPDLKEIKGAAPTIHNSINEFLKSKSMGNLLSGRTGHSREGFERWEKLVERGLAERIVGYSDPKLAVYYNLYKLKKKGGWIQKAIKNPGALTEQAKKEKMSIAEFCNKENLNTKTKKRCNLAKNLKNLK